MSQLTQRWLGGVHVVGVVAAPCCLDLVHQLTMMVMLSTAALGAVFGRHYLMFQQCAAVVIGVLGTIFQAGRSAWSSLQHDLDWVHSQEALRAIRLHNQTIPHHHASATPHLL